MSTHNFDPPASGPGVGQGSKDPRPTPRSSIGVQAALGTHRDHLLTVAALFVDPRGPYCGRPDIDAWDEQRDARLYTGTHPVVAHPPCSRWCRLAKLVEARWGHRVGDDGGCFEAALRAVRQWHGVLEHPAWSLAWSALELQRPGSFGWSRSLFRPREWVCEVAQSAYGHLATKLTWLLYVGDNPPPPLDWSKPRGSKVVGHMSRRGDGTIWRRNVDRISKAAASRTPPAFAELLVQLARHARTEPT